VIDGRVSGGWVKLISIKNYYYYGMVILIEGMNPHHDTFGLKASKWFAGQGAHVTIRASK
jgi:hypothetical protein